MNTKKQEIGYRKKLNQSYHICLEELFNPHPEWEDIINLTKYTIDPILKIPKTSHTFILEFSDNIYVPNSSHTYIFKRNQFYQKFKNPQSRIHQDLIAHFNPMGFIVHLFKDERINKWCLRLTWKEVIARP